MGATATGKTDLALRLASVYPVEIISVDSALIYQDMDIGSAKPSLSELSTVPHHLINIMTPLETYSVANFINDSIALIDEITSRGAIPMLVGGTMMYYNGLLNGISSLPHADATIRKELLIKGESVGFDKLHQELMVIDKIASSKIMPNDKQRIIRALEVFYLTGVPISRLQIENKVHLASGIDFLPLAIIPQNRDILHSRINLRFDKMLTNGFIDEVKNLQAKYEELTINHTAMRSVGYYQVWQYLSGMISYVELVDTGTAATRQLAKRQITWLRSMNTINLDNGELSLDYLFKELSKRVNGFLSKT